jgi:queuine/archaeosine tRNA-ribosyltransferase
MGKLINFCAGVSLEILPAKQVDAILLNVPHNASSEKQIQHSIKLIKESGASITALDSGGFQLLQAEDDGIYPTFDESKPVIFDGKTANLTPRHVVEAATLIKPTIMMSLDYPIQKGIEDPFEMDREFYQKLGFNACWARETSKLWQQYCPEVQLFIPVQCDNLNHLDKFIDLIGDAKFSGLSMPIRRMSLAKIALFLIRYYQMKIRRVHVLGSTSFSTIALAAYFARHFFEWVSIDATTWRLQAQNGNYLNFYDLKPHPIGENVRVDENAINDCECPFCRGTSFTQIKNMPFTEKTFFLMCHNWWVIEKAARDLYAHCGSVIELEQLLKKRCRKTDDVTEICKTLSQAHALKDLDIYEAEKLMLQKV